MAGRQAHGAIQTRETRQALRQVCLAGAGHGRGGPCAAAAARQRRYRTTPRPRTCISFTASGRPCTSPLTVPCSRPGVCGCIAAGEAQGASPHTAPQACGCWAAHARHQRPWPALPCPCRMKGACSTHLRCVHHIAHQPQRSRLVHRVGPEEDALHCRRWGSTGHRPCEHGRRRAAAGSASLAPRLQAAPAQPAEAASAHAHRCREPRSQPAQARRTALLRASHLPPANQQTGGGSGGGGGGGGGGRALPALAAEA